jgi:predicted nucleic acid-binding protein
MKSFKILKVNCNRLNYVLNERTGYYDVEENQDLEDDDLRSVGLLDMIVHSDIEIIRIKRTQDNEIFSLNDTIVLSDNNTIKYKITFFDINQGVISQAKDLVDIPYLKSLDSIHIATVKGIQNYIKSVITYDKQMIRALQDLELPTASPA